LYFLTHEISYTVCIDSMCNTNLHIIFVYFHYGAVHKVRHATRVGEVTDLWRYLGIVLHQPLELWRRKVGEGVKNWPKLRYILYGRPLCMFVCLNQNFDKGTSPMLEFDSIVCRWWRIISLSLAPFIFDLQTSSGWIDSSSASYHNQANQGIKILVFLVLMNI
jgi:hypothetical protein